MTKRTQQPKAGGRRDQLRQQAAAEAARRKRTRILLSGVAVVAAAVLVVGVVLGVRVLQNRGEAAAGVVPPSSNAEQTAIVVNPEAPETAPVFTLFQDYQCPACKSFEDTYAASLAQLAEAGDIRLEYHTMTFLDSALRNSSSLDAGVAAACADVAGHYSDYHDTLYRNQPSEGRGFNDNQLLTQYPAEAGIEGAALDTFRSCYRGRDTEPFVEGTDAAAGAAGVTGTPTIMIDGEIVPTEQLPAPDQLGAFIAQR